MSPKNIKMKQIKQMQQNAVGIFVDSAGTRLRSPIVVQVRPRTDLAAAAADLAGRPA